MPIKYTIRQGDSIVDVAYRNGFFADTVWEHPDNAELRERRRNKNILMPGDVLTIPDKREKEESAVTGKRHRYRIKGIPAVLRLQLFDGDELPRANQTYKVTIRGPGYETPFEGVTDGEGILKMAVPPSATEGDLVIGPDQLRIKLRLGHLDPIEELSGVQKRLNNLGFSCGEPDGKLNPATRRALAAFQIRFGLPETGEIDDVTRAKIGSMHDAPSEFPGEPSPGP